MRRLISVVPVLILVLAVGAAAAPLPGKGADACKLVPKSEIEQIMGLKLADGVKEPRMQSEGVLSSCDYKTAAGGQVSILIRHNLTKYVVGSEKAEFEKRGMKPRYVQSFGPGNVAFFTDMFGMGTGLNVFRGDNDYVLVTGMMVGDVPKISPNLEKLTKVVLERWK